MPSFQTIHFHLILILLACPRLFAAQGFAPGDRVLLDAHNCYPYQGLWADRIDRAIATGTPLAIEQDLAWYVDPATGQGRSIVSHGRPFTGREPSMKEYFFERIRPIIEQALASGDNRNWPLVTLNLDFKDDGPEHCATIWSMLDEYEHWLCTAPKNSDPSRREPLDLKPLLILTGESAAQERVFHDVLPVGAKLRIFGASKSSPRLGNPKSPATPEALLTAAAGNYRRWWNNSWQAVEPEGQPRAAEWTTEEQARLQAFVSHAHKLGYWIRFYTLNGHTKEQGEGWGGSYNFGTPEAARLRWAACREAGVDFIASDQYEDLAAFLKAP